MPKVSVVTIPAKSAELPLIERKNTGLTYKRRLIKWPDVRVWIDVRTIFLFAVGFLLGRVFILSEIAPFGLAYFSAMAQAKVKYVFGIAVWTLAGVLSVGAYPEAAVYFLSMTMYFFFSRKMNRQHYQIKAVPLFMFGAIFVSQLVVGLWQTITLYTVMVAFIEACMSAVLGYLFLYAVPLYKGLPVRQKISNEMLACAVIVMAVAIAGFGEVTMLGYSLRNMMGILMILLVAYAGGAGLGTAVGVVVGTIFGISEGNISLLVAIYSISGLLAGIFCSIGRFAVVLGFLLGSTVILLYNGQAVNLTHLLTEVTAASLVMFVIPPGVMLSWNMALNSGHTLIFNSNNVVNTVSEKLAELSAIFNDLAKAIGAGDSNEAIKTQRETISLLLTNIGEKVCQDCEQRDLCWNKNFYHSYQDAVTMLNLATNKKLTTATAPADFVKRCSRANHIIKAIELTHSSAQEKIHFKKKITDSRQVVGEHLKALSDIIVEMIHEVNNQPLEDSSIESTLREKLALIDCSVENIKVSGEKNSRFLEIIKQPCNGNQECRNTILPFTANLLGEKLLLRSQCGKKGRNPCRLAMQTAKSLAVDTGVAFLPKQKYTGDCCKIIPLKNGNMVLMLSDGMGTGLQAKDQSFAAIKYFERLLMAGFNVDVAVQTVNSMLILKTPQEAFTTMDLAIVNTYTGETQFFKNGSAPSYIKRVGEVSVIKSNSLPMGVINQVEIVPVKCTLMPRDIIVMVSDGIIDSAAGDRGKESWLVNYLRLINSNDPQVIADSILDKAKQLAGTHIRDDMTVLVAVLSASEE